MAKRRFQLSGIAVLTWMFVMLYPFSSYAQQTVFSQELDKLLTILNVPHSSGMDNLIAASQVWRRSPGQERWEMKDLEISEQTHDKAMRQLELLGLVKAIKPSRQNYDYALVLGATVPRMQKRFDHLIELWESGVRFNKIIFLVGLRPLIPEVDKVSQLIVQATGADTTDETTPVTELEGAQMLYHAANMPEAMKDVSVEFVDTPRRWTNHRWHRPNTRDTLHTWYRSKPTPGTALVMTEQPSAHYQAEVVRQELNGFTLEVAARAAQPDIRLVLFLDALALWLDNLQIQQENIGLPTSRSCDITVSPTRH